MAQNGRYKELISPVPRERLEKLTANQVMELEQQRMLLNHQLVENVLSIRQEVFRATTDPRRNIYDECGFPKDPTAITYQDLYDRDGVACRVVEVMPKETWRVTPEVYELEESDEPTPFEEAWDKLHRTLRGERSWFKEEKGSPVWSYLIRLDILAGIGRFGVMLLGLDDGLPLWEPVEGVEESGSIESEAVAKEGEDKEGTKLPEGQMPLGKRPPRQRPVSNSGKLPVYKLTVNEEKTKDRQLLFLRVFPESLVQIVRFEANPTSPRFGLPVIYQITLYDQREQYSGVGLPQGTYDVHWTRIIHYAENLKSSEWAGTPRMRPVLNYLLSLQKLYGAAPEGYWRNCINKLFLSTHPQLGGDVDVNLDELKDVFENMENGLQKWAFLRGMTPQTVQATLVDPTPHKNMLIEAICVTQGIPVPVFKGYEIGEQASDNNKKDWEGRVKHRQFGVTTPGLIIQFVDRLVMVGVLPEPTERPKAQTEVIDPETGEPKTDPITGEPIMEDELGPDGEPLKAGPDGEPIEPESEADVEGAAEDKEDEKALTKRIPVGPPKPPVHNVISLTGMGLPPRTYEGTRGQYGMESFGFQGAMGQGLGKGKDGEKPPPVESDLGYCVDWPDISTASDKEKAEVLGLKVQAYTGYAQGMAQMVPELDFMTKFDDFDEEEAQAMLDAATKLAEEQEIADIEKQEEMIDKGLAPDPELDQEAKLEAAKKGIPPGAMGGPPGFGGGPPKPPFGGGPPKPGGPPGKKPPFAANAASEHITSGHEALIINMYEAELEGLVDGKGAKR